MAHGYGVRLAEASHADEWGAVFEWSKIAYKDAYLHRGTARLAAAVEAKELAEVVAEQVRPPVPVAAAWWPDNLPIGVGGVET